MLSFSPPPPKYLSQPLQITFSKVGVNKTVSTDHDINSNKMIIERNAKLPRVLKDMLDMLLQEKQGDASKLCTFGVLHSGLYMQVISVDRPNDYVTRVNEGRPLQIPVDERSFGEKVLPILVQVYHLKQMVKAVYENIRLSETPSLNNANWLDHCLDKQTRAIIPTTSSSTETARKK